MTDFLPELPQDVIDDVLLRLPARSIGRFRCVSKPWRSHLSSPEFIKSHFKFHSNKTVPDVIVRVKDLPHLLTFAGDGNGRSRKVTCPFFKKRMKVRASCYGFVLVESDRRHVINPVTLESFELPEFSYPPAVRARVMYGMGYDSCDDDYKIVQLVYDDDYHLLDMFDKTYVGVYSFKKRCWSEVMESPYYHSGDRVIDGGTIGEEPGIYMNGYLHWVALGKESEDYVIAAFNLAREEFEEVPLPKYFDGSTEIIELVILRECLAMLCWSKLSYDCSEIWLMKEYGVQESWDKYVVDARGRDASISAVLSLSREDELVMVGRLDSFKRKMVACNLITGAWRDVVVDDLPDEFYYEGLTFTECLLSPNQISAE